MPNLNGFLEFTGDLAQCRHLLQLGCLNFLMRTGYDLVEFPIIDELESIKELFPALKDSDLFQFYDPESASTACVPPDLTLQAAKYFHRIYAGREESGGIAQSKICYSGRVAKTKETDKYGNRSLLICGAEVAHVDLSEITNSIITCMAGIYTQADKSLLQSGVVVSFTIPELCKLMFSEVDRVFLDHFNALDNDFLCAHRGISAEQSDSIGKVLQAVLTDDIDCSLDLMRSIADSDVSDAEKLIFLVEQIRSSVKILSAEFQKTPHQIPVSFSFGIEDSSATFLNYEGVNFSIYVKNATDSAPIARGGAYDLKINFTKIACLGFTIYLDRLY